MHTKLIQRGVRTPESTLPPPWADISFVYDIESDELADALRFAFPGYKNLRERKHAAVINFFEQELREMQSNGLNTMPAQMPADRDLRRSDTRMDVCGVGHLSDSSAPPPSPASSLNSAVHQDLERQYAATQVTSSRSLPADPTLATSSTHHVFSAFDGRPMHQKTKRKMTSKERQDYKLTRQRGACAKCKRQKGKCTHKEDDSNFPLIDANRLTENFQSLGTDTNDSKPSIPDRAESTFNTYNCDVDTSHQSAVSSQQPSRRSSNATNRSPTTPDQLQWPTAGGAQLDTSRYVNPSPSYQQNHDSFSDQLSPYWSGYNGMDLSHGDHMDPSQPENDSQGQYTFLGSPSICVQGPDPETSFPLAYHSSNHSSNHWNQG